jgi:hypothetical protein
LSGTVSDYSGALPPAEKITLLSDEHGISRTFVIDATGNCMFSLPPPAVYSLRAEAPGFKTYLQNGISLAAWQTAEQPIVLTVGSISEKVEVPAPAPCSMRTMPIFLPTSPPSR